MKTARTTWIAMGLAVISLMVWCSPGLASHKVLPGKIGDYGKYFNPESVESFSGVVLEVYHQHYSPRRSLCCTAIRVERDDGEGEAIVYLGPDSQLKEEGYTISAGEDVCILGSAATIDGQTVFIAQQLNRGNYVLTLRSKNGLHSSISSAVLEEDNEDTCLVAYFDH